MAARLCREEACVLCSYHPIFPTCRPSCGVPTLSLLITYASFKQGTRRAPQLARRRFLRRMIQATGPRAISPCPGPQNTLYVCFLSADRVRQGSAIRNPHPAESTLQVSQPILYRPEASIHVCCSTMEAFGAIIRSFIWNLVNFLADLRPKTMMRVGLWSLRGIIKTYDFRCFSRRYAQTLRIVFVSLQAFSLSGQAPCRNPKQVGGKKPYKSVLSGRENPLLARHDGQVQRARIDAPEVWSWAVGCDIVK